MIKDFFSKDNDVLKQFVLFITFVEYIHVHNYIPLLLIIGCTAFSIMGM